LVLLRNNGVLPLTPATQKMAVIGPNANNSRNLFGDYTHPAHIESLREMRQEGRNLFDIPGAETTNDGDASVHAPTVLDAMRDRFGSNVTFARGCEVKDESRDGFAEAVALAAAADVAVLVMGDKSGLTDECTSGESCDRVSLDLPGVQEDLVRAVIATKTPVVMVLVSGRPSASAWIHEHCAAILMAWMPGQEGAAAIADALTGEVCPGGKLPISYPRTAGQIPVFYGHKTSGGRSQWKGDYVDSPASPLYPFGYGLSYTTFDLLGASVRPGELIWSDSVTVEATVANTGMRSGDEVVQLYSRKLRASVTRPVLELKSFIRVELEAGNSKTVTFEVPAGQLGFYDRDMSHVVEPGVVEFLIGSSSEDLVSAGSVTIVPDPNRPAVKVFDGSVTVQ
jgi:beta-glucosidase